MIGELVLKCNQKDLGKVEKIIKKYKVAIISEHNRNEHVDIVIAGVDRRINKFYRNYYNFRTGFIKTKRNRRSRRNKRIRVFVNS